MDALVLPEPRPGHGGFGMGAVRARLAAAFGPAATLSVVSPWPAEADGGTRLIIHIPQEALPSP